MRKWIYVWHLISRNCNATLDSRSMLCFESFSFVLNLMLKFWSKTYLSLKNIFSLAFLYFCWICELFIWISALSTKSSNATKQNVNFLNLFFFLILFFSFVVCLCFVFVLFFCAEYLVPFQVISASRFFWSFYLSLHWL